MADVRVTAAFAQAIDLTIEKFSDHFDGKAEQVKRLLHADMTKFEIAAALQCAGVKNQSDLAQAILNCARRILKW